MAAHRGIGHIARQLYHLALGVGLDIQHQLLHGDGAVVGAACTHLATHLVEAVALQQGRQVGREGVGEEAETQVLDLCVGIVALHAVAQVGVHRQRQVGGAVGRHRLCREVSVAQLAIHRHR